MSSLRTLFCLPSVKKQKHDFFCFFFQCIMIKVLFVSVFVISRIIKVEVRVISRSRSRRLRLITPYLDLDSSGYQENLIQWWFTKLEYNNLVKFTYILFICESSLVDDVVLSCLKSFIYVTSIRFSVTNSKFPRFFMNWNIFYLSSNIKV